MVSGGAASAAAAAAVVGVVSLLLYAYHALWRRPEMIRAQLRRQGIRGPDSSFLVGNIPEMTRTSEDAAATASVGGGGVEPPRHDYFARLFPYFGRWSELYGTDRRRALFYSLSLLYCFVYWVFSFIIKTGAYYYVEFFLYRIKYLFYR